MAGFIGTRPSLWTVKVGEAELTVETNGLSIEGFGAIL
jgi:hypothetical protein